MQALRHSLYHKRQRTEGRAVAVLAQLPAPALEVCKRQPAAATAATVKTVKTAKMKRRSRRRKGESSR
jgi:hypothetical protein